MKRVAIDIRQIADCDNLAEAAWKAAKGKRNRDAVWLFMFELDKNLRQLSSDIFHGRLPHGTYEEFYVRDPKPRCIHAPCFQDRIFHHALINYLGPVLERAMIDHSYACRKGKGPLAAVKRVQRNIRRYPWYVKIDIRSYFPSVDHELLLQLLSRKVKGPGIYDMLERIINSHTEPGTIGKGLPIGSLTSQYFANYYLDGMDRCMGEEVGVSGYVRYMDDMIWWCETRQDACRTLELAERYAWEQRKLQVKAGSQINRSSHGVGYCGVRVYSGTLRLSERRKKLYTMRRHDLESRFMDGRLTECGLQQEYASVHSLAANCNSLMWRRNHYRRYPSNCVE